ncbi:hypothetical protein Trydic_g7451 [Trypoxylus dichotomus]
MVVLFLLPGGLPVPASSITSSVAAAGSRVSTSPLHRQGYFPQAVVPLVEKGPVPGDSPGLSSLSYGIMDCSSCRRGSMAKRNMADNAMFRKLFSISRNYSFSENLLYHCMASKADESMAKVNSFLVLFSPYVKRVLNNRKHKIS